MMRSFLLAATLLACATPHDPVALIEQRPVIELPGIGIPGGSVFEVPGAIVAGQPFPVTYATFGSSSCSRHLSPEVMAGTDGLTIVPRLAPLGPTTPCTDDIATVRHTATLTWTGPRVPELRLRLRGYRFDGTVVEVERRASMP